MIEPNATPDANDSAAVVVVLLLLSSGRLREHASAPRRMRRWKQKMVIAQVDERTESKWQLKRWKEQNRIAAENREEWAAAWGAAAEAEDAAGPASAAASETERGAR